MNWPLVEAIWLREHCADDNLRIVDTRFALGKPDHGRTSYLQGHIPSAVFVDLERDLCAQVRADRVGGRHPIPPVAALEAVLGRLGISNQHLVVAYDDPSAGTGFYAAHLWWLLHYLGHDNVVVLNGGLPAWVAAGGAVETREPFVNSSEFRAQPRPEMIVDAVTVQSRPESTILLDSRAPERFRGEIEPLDWKAGHIPGALNANWADGLRDGFWKSPSEQRERLPEAQDLIVYCGSGVSAAGNLFALEIAGVTHAKLYPGSWSDWISDDSRPIATGPLPRG